MAGSWAGGNAFDGLSATPEEVDMFLSNYPVEPHAVQLLKSLDPYQQKAVISRGSLAEARDPTAIVRSRCKKAMQSTVATSATVVVRGMDFGTTDDQLAAHMSCVGTVQNVKWVTKGTAEVVYGSADEALYACQSLNQSIIPGNSRYIDVLPQDAGQWNWSQDKRSAPTAPGSTVFVRGFDFGTTQEQFASHMSSVGTITNVNLIDKGSAEVTYSNATEAAMAIQQLNNTTIPGNTRYIDVLTQEAGQSSSAKRPKTDGPAPDKSMMMEMMKWWMQAMGGGSGAEGAEGTASIKPSWPTSNFDPEQQQLIGSVKSFQKSSQENKQTWYSFCDMQPGAKYDPAKYDPNVLKMFLASVGAM